tara:strand:- start:792 stop:1508 length:717 start_codon:yes stop_codon:yes gene_type:complete
MSRIFLILALIGAFIVWKRWQKINSKDERKEFIYKGLVFGLVIFIIALAVFGRIDMLGAVFASLLLGIKYILAFLIRHFPFIARIYGVTGGFGLGKKRSLKTEWLKISIDFQTRKIDGEVLKGAFQGNNLGDMSEPDLQKLLEECSSDTRSAYFLRMYMQQRFNGGYQSQGGSQSQQASGEMTTAEAMEILGLEGSPTDKDIRDAHKRLMQRLHPDRGGNDFLASLLNRARDHLMSKK